MRRQPRRFGYDETRLFCRRQDFEHFCAAGHRFRLLARHEVPGPGDDPAGDQ